MTGPHPILRLLAAVGPVLFVANEVRGAITVVALLSGGAHEIARYADFIRHTTEGLFR